MTRSLLAVGKRAARFPRAEQELEKRFKDRRSHGLRVSERWFFTTMLQLVRNLYPGSQFVASRGWLYRCVHRLGIGRRTKTNCKSHSASDRIPAIREWLVGFRRMLCTPLSKTMKMDPTWGRFPPELRFNCDQVPLAFVNDMDRTFDRVGGLGEANLYVTIMLLSEPHETTASTSHYLQRPRHSISRDRESSLAS